MRIKFLCLLLSLVILLSLTACVPESEKTVDPSTDDPLTDSTVLDNNVTLTKNITQLTPMNRSDLTEEFLTSHGGVPALISALYISDSSVVFSTQWNVLVAKAKDSDWEFSFLRCSEYTQSYDHGYLMRGDAGLLAIMGYYNLLLLDPKSGNIDVIEGKEILYPLAWDGNDLYIGYNTPRYTALYIYHSDTDIIEELPIDEEKYKDIANREYKGDRLYYSKEEHQKAIEDILMAE